MLVWVSVIVVTGCVRREKVSRLAACRNVSGAMRGQGSQDFGPRGEGQKKKAQMGPTSLRAIHGEESYHSGVGQVGLWVGGS